MQTTCTPTTCRPRITFQDTNVVGNVYFLTFLRWQAECRDQWLRLARPELWDAIRTGESPLAVIHWSTRFDDPVGATVGDDVRVSMEIEELENGYCALATIARISASGTEKIGSGKMRFTTSAPDSLAQYEELYCRCYEFTATCPRISELNPHDLIAWQGKCRELFLADHAPRTLQQVASRQLALQTTSASLEILQIPSFAPDEVHVEMRLTDIKGGQIAVQFDYFAQLNGQILPFATGQQ